MTITRKVFIAIQGLVKSNETCGRIVILIFCVNSSRTINPLHKFWNCTYFFKIKLKLKNFFSYIEYKRRFLRIKGLQLEEILSNDTSFSKIWRKYFVFPFIARELFIHKISNWTYFQKMEWKLKKLFQNRIGIKEVIANIIHVLQLPITRKHGRPIFLLYIFALSQICPMSNI